MNAKIARLLSVDRTDVVRIVLARILEDLSQVSKKWGEEETG